MNSKILAPQPSKVRLFMLVCCIHYQVSSDLVQVPKTNLSNGKSVATFASYAMLMKLKKGRNSFPWLLAIRPIIFRGSLKG